MYMSFTHYMYVHNMHTSILSRFSWYKSGWNETPLRVTYRGHCPLLLSNTGLVTISHVSENIPGFGDLNIKSRVRFLPGRMTPIMYSSAHKMLSINFKAPNLLQYQSRTAAEFVLKSLNQVYYCWETSIKIRNNKS